MSTPAVTPPGWYADPWRPGGQRWWDGSDWTGHATGGPAPDLAGNRKWAGWASKAYLVQGGGLALTVLTLPIIFAGYFEVMGDAFSEASTSTPRIGGGFIVAFLALNVVSLLTTAAQVVLCVWSYQATTTVRRLGRPTTHTPGWAAAAWFVPIVNYWFPYQVVRDLLPEAHPLRARVKLWWGCYLGAALFAVVPIVVSAFSLPAALALALVAAALAVVAGVTGSRIAAGAADDHDAAAAGALAAASQHRSG